MTRLLAPATGCIEVETDRHHYRGRVLEVSDESDIKDLRAAGYTVGDVSGEPSRSSGRRCVDCGFSGWFTTCGRCGGACERE